MTAPLRPLPPNSTIGIVGGGQLGRMSAMAAARLGYRCHILTPEPDSPAPQVSAGVTLGDYEDSAALRDFAAHVDVITFEFENVSAEGLDLLASLKPVHPSPAVLRISQDRVAEKSFLNGIGVPTAPWRAVETFSELEAAVAALGLPAILKTTRLGYDGRGQARLNGPADLAPAFEALLPRPLILEGMVDFACEISVVAARGADGGYAAFDTVENRHRDHILDLTLAPARIPEQTAAAAQALARHVADGLALVGLLALELFVTADGRVLANEIAPRPHNSGHWTIDACLASQFELHIRAVAGLPLPKAERHSDAVMKNLVGPAETALWPDDPGDAGLDPPSVRQGGGAAGPQDGPRDAAVPARKFAGRIRGCGGAGGAWGGRSSILPDCSRKMIAAALTICSWPGSMWRAIRDERKCIDLRKDNFTGGRSEGQPAPGSRDLSSASVDGRNERHPCKIPPARNAPRGDRTDHEVAGTVAAGIGECSGDPRRRSRRWQMTIFTIWFRSGSNEASARPRRRTLPIAWAAEAEMETHPI